MSTRRDKVAVLISGTQGEPMSALSRVAVDNHKIVSVEEGDTVVLSSRIIPGNEKAIFRMIEPHGAPRRGRDVRIDESAAARFRTRQRRGIEAGAEPGAAAVSSFRFTANTGRWRSTRKLAEHLRLAGLEDTFILETGETLEIDQSRRAQRPARSQVGRVCIDSGTIDDVVRGYRDPRPPASLRRRLRAADHRHQQAHRPAGKVSPEMVSRGFVSTTEDEFDSSMQARLVCADAGSSSEEESGDWGVMQEKIRADLKRFIVKQTPRRPLIMPVILESVGGAGRRLTVEDAFPASVAAGRRARPFTPASAADVAAGLREASAGEFR